MGKIIKLKVMLTDPDRFTNAKLQLENAFRYIKISDDAQECLRHPKTVVQVSIPVHMDDEAPKVFQGYRVRYDDTHGPTKGGIRYYPLVNLAEITALAFGMTFKCAIANPSFRGTKGGIVVDSKILSNLELERLNRGDIDVIADFIALDVDIPVPDVYTNQMLMGWSISTV